MLNLFALLFFQNKALRLSNESLRKHSEAVEIENSELRVRLGLTPPVSPEPVNHMYPQSPEPTPSKPSSVAPSKPSSVVIKKETECNEYASLTVSQQQERLILFLSLITTWMMINNRYVTSVLNFLSVMDYFYNSLYVLLVNFWIT